MKRGMGGAGGEEGENEAAADESETRTPDAGKSQLGLRSPVTTASAPASAGRRQPALPLTRTCAHTPLAPISRQLLESGPSAPVPRPPGSRSSRPGPRPGHQRSSPSLSFPSLGLNVPFPTPSPRRWPSPPHAAPATTSASRSAPHIFLPLFNSLPSLPWKSQRPEALLGPSPSRASPQPHALGE